ncbi:SMP-30/gluconolactonase/LRE family protein [Gordonia sp. (in: high G+C Gram-positive bacteria)]|uniref:SMP-30/gluconolactonase/LRE family protein n=1 Tax=Gordonia sp. (in: high G+C Gram-positive bacteria) TaxID=84139 RepID=UPI0039E5A093
MQMRTTVLVPAVLAGALVAAPVVPASAAPTCGSVSTSTAARATTPVQDWAENLGYDADGKLWVSRLRTGRVERLTRGRVTASVAVADPGAVRRGPDGRMYVAAGTSSTNMLPGVPHTGTILRFDPSAPRPVARPFAAGFAMPNGMVFGADKALYVADSGQGILRVRPDGSVDRGWTARTGRALAPLINGFGVNGITIAGDTLYATLTTSATGRMLRVPVGRPEAASSLDLTAPVPGSLDDLVALPGHRLAVASVAGDLFLVDTRTGAVCSRNLGQPLTSIVADPHHPTRLTVGTESGDLLAVRVR